MRDVQVRPPRFVLHNVYTIICDDVILYDVQTFYPTAMPAS